MSTLTNSRPPTSDGSPLRITNLLADAQEALRALETAGGLSTAAGQLLDLARSIGVSKVKACSAASERVVGAAVVVGNGAIESYRDGTPTDAVLLVDLTFASGVTFARAAQRLSQCGVCTVHGAAFVGFGGLEQNWVGNGKLFQL